MKQFARLCSKESITLYVTILYEMTPSPVVELNRAVAGALLEGIESGMLLLNRLAETGELDDYYLVHAARADLRRHSGKVDEAHSAYTRALGRCQNNTERSFLRRRLAEIDGQTRR